MKRVKLCFAVNKRKGFLFMIFLCTIYDCCFDYLSLLQCSKTCGTGIQRRIADCVNDMNELVDEKECRKSERIEERSCGTQKCPHWAVGEWAPVSTIKECIKVFLYLIS